MSNNFDNLDGMMDDNQEPPYQPPEKKWWEDSDKPAAVAATITLIAGAFLVGVIVIAIALRLWDWIAP